MNQNNMLYLAPLVQPILPFELPSSSLANKYHTVHLRTFLNYVNVDLMLMLLLYFKKQTI